MLHTQYFHYKFLMVCCYWFKFKPLLRVQLGSAFALPKRMFCFSFVFFFDPKYLTFLVNSARCALFTDLQILLFNNFFIKNGSHSTIHIFKNYFATVFFSFQMYPNGP